MNRLTRTLPILLAIALQILPLVRNFFLNPATGSNIAFILRWGIGAGAAIGTVDAVSGATNYFTSTNIFTGTVGVPFTNNLTLLSSGKDGLIIATITSNSVSVSLTSNGQTTNFAMPPGLNFRLIDNTALTNGVYDAIFGTPTAPCTNTFNIFMSYAAQNSVSTNITIRILAATSLLPVITNQPVGLTNVAGANATFTVTAGGVPAPAYQWRLLSTPLPGATNSSLTLTNARASQAGNYTVVLTNTAGSVTSSVASLVITNPLPPQITAPLKIGSLFQFTFIPVVGLTNSVVTNSALSGGVWTVLTNVPPPATASPVTISDPFGSSNRFYRVLISP